MSHLVDVTLAIGKEVDQKVGEERRKNTTVEKRKREDYRVTFPLLLDLLFHAMKT